MESVNVSNETNDHPCLQGLYFIALLVDLVLYLVAICLAPMILFGLAMGGVGSEYVPRIIIHFSISIIIYTVGWIGFRTKFRCAVFIYGINSFVQSVYMVISFVEWGMNIINILLVIRIPLSILILRYAYVLIAEKWRMNHVERNDEPHSMESMNVNNYTNCLRVLYMIGLSADLVSFALLAPAVFAAFVFSQEKGDGSRDDAFLITHCILTVEIDTVGWTGYYTKIMYPVVIYGIALFVQNVYVLVWIVKWAMDLETILLIIRSSFSIPVLGYAYVLIAKKWRTSHVERNIEAHSMEPMNVNNATESPVERNDENHV